jgi:transposase-like protein
MPRKGKISAAEKVAAVAAWQQGRMSKWGIARKFGIDKKTLLQWIMLYETRGREGLMPPSQNRRYSPNLKMQVVQEYLSGRGSQLELCKKYSISHPYMVSEWVKRYNGHNGFKQPNSGRGIYMTKGRATTLDERIEIVRYCIEQGKDYGAAIERYQVSYQQVYSWVRKYEELGIAGLNDKRGKRKPLEEMTEVERLRAENRMLQAENKRKEMEIAILKKLQEVERRLG